MKTHARLAHLVEGSRVQAKLDDKLKSTTEPLTIGSRASIGTDSANA